MLTKFLAFIAAMSISAPHRPPGSATGPSGQPPWKTASALPVIWS